MARKRSNSCELKDIILPHEYLKNATINQTWPLPSMLKKDCQQEQIHLESSDVFSLSTYLEELKEEEIKKYLVPEKYILKSFNFRFGKYKNQYLCICILFTNCYKYIRYCTSNRS